ncbi:MAG TPA: class I SAM-dependent methyltransferase [Pirellula sp.]|nr:class I SAM-dependent methyltransferase [Pirellula sp.]
MMNTTLDFESRLNELDLDLFKCIHSESKPGDKRSWLAMQRAVRRANDAYVYLEIGSHLGGSIQPYLLDGKCRRIYSIDKRPVEPPDDRGLQLRYEGNSTARMIENLRAIDAVQVAKIVCFDLDARDIDRKQVPEAPDLCFIDGEHTTAAVLSDFEFCLRVCAPNAVIAFHDDRIIAPAIVKILQNLRSTETSFAAYKLQGSTFAIALGASAKLSRHLPDDMVTDGCRAIRRMQMRRFLKAFVPASIRAIGRKWVGYKD